jgi:2-polyprenyl-6-methoxyphenol hydroxylase-like FAD-dependent oxidoreductase
MPGSKNPDVLIVGAGPVGLTMAASLNQQGLSCRIIDKAAQPSDKSKALVVWSRSLELLDKLALADTFVKSGMKATGASIYRGGKRLVHITIADVDSPFNFPLMIPQSETERLLTEHLSRRGVSVERQVELISFTDRSDAVTATLRGPDGREEMVEAPWLIGCDGAHSTARHGLGISFTGDTEQNDWILADLHLDGPIPPNEVGIYWHEKGVVAFFPINQNRYRMIADLGPAAHTRSPADPTLADVQAKIDERGPAGVKASNPVWLSGFRINERKVADYRKGRVFLAGDAAHIHSPAGGQGMNTGMQDAFNLAWKLALVHRGIAQVGPLLDSYSLERSAVGEQVLRGAGMMTLMATLRNPVAQFVRDHAAPVITSFGFVRDKVKNTLCELTINYRNSPMAAEDWSGRSGNVHAGDRTPDAPLIDSAGNATSLFAATRRNNFAMLLLPGSDGTQGISRMRQFADSLERDFSDLFYPLLILKPGTPVSESSGQEPCMIDRESRIHDRFGVIANAVVLVRPDGYIAYRGQPASVAALRAYLKRFVK